MSKKEYLNEENYQNTKEKVSKVALIVLIIGFLIGGFLIALGIINHSKINSRYSEENKAAALEKLEGEKQIFIEDLSVEKQKIINSKTEIENKIKPIEDQIKGLERVAFNGFDDDYYARKDKIEELEKMLEGLEKTEEKCEVLIKVFSIFISNFSILPKPQEKAERDLHTTCMSNSNALPQAIAEQAL